MTISARRLRNQGITRTGFTGADQVVEWLGAVQAQEYQPAKWALGLRMRDATDEAVERAVEDGEILRTHVMCLDVALRRGRRISDGCRR